MADEHDTGEGSRAVELAQIRKIVKEEVAKALQTTIPTHMDGMQASLLDSIRQEFATLKASGDVERPSRKVTYKDFVACKPAEFKGEVDPLLSQRWIADMEGTFETCHCDATDEVVFAGNQLRERAKDWWELLRKEKGREGVKSLTWAEFKELFLKRFCPQAAIDRITEEFLHMRHKDESIDTITAVFFDKARFCPDLLQTERMWINRYHSMLNAKYREFLTPSKCETLSELIDCARERELELNRQEERGEKRKAEKEGGSSKKPKFSNSPKKFAGSLEVRHCTTCGRNHLGECYAKSMNCYKCGKQGHLATQCTSPLNLCYNCYKPGHKKSECPEIRGAASSGGDNRSFKGSGSGKKFEPGEQNGRLWSFLGKTGTRQFSFQPAKSISLRFSLSWFKLVAKARWEMIRELGSVVSFIVNLLVWVYALVMGCWGPSRSAKGYWMPVALRDRVKNAENRVLSSETAEARGLDSGRLETSIEATRS
ncbi:hypothetical protein E3N88_38016 [Mikania micrantha]|uniref:CCHC-type domain-containing protein n=1 Tax=Mikania micrantha TaxID=192012 RepID=A0A5N6LSW7_9ASTR|nr:hypothetical protein E3N88_38016 [Mikania micrantha]